MKNILIIFSVLLVFISCKYGNNESEQKAAKVICQPKDKEILTEIFKQFDSEKNMDIADLIIGIGNSLKETPYVAHTLETEKEKLVVNLRELDCTTFAENCLAISRTIKNGKPDFESFTEELQNIRYYKGDIQDYTSRIHYFSDWIYENHSRGIIADVSKQIALTPYTLNTGFMSSHPGSYSSLKADSTLVPLIAEKEKEINSREMFYIPETKLAELESKLKNGDIVGITTAIKGLDISHVGILVWKSGRVHLMHASSAAKKVIVSEETLEEYLLKSKNATGIMVARPN